MPLRVVFSIVLPFSVFLSSIFVLPRSPEEKPCPGLDKSWPDEEPGARARCVRRQGMRRRVLWWAVSSGLTMLVVSPVAAAKAERGFA